MQTWSVLKEQMSPINRIQGTFFKRSQNVPATKTERKEVIIDLLRFISFYRLNPIVVQFKELIYNI